MELFGTMYTEVRTRDNNPGKRSGADVAQSTEDVVTEVEATHLELVKTTCHHYTHADAVTGTRCLGNWI